MNEDQRLVAAAFADARKEVLEERPLGCAALNTTIDRLVRAYTERDPGFDAVEFRMAANYRGMADGTTRYGLLPYSTP